MPTARFAGLSPHGAPPLFFTFDGLTATGVPHVTTTRHCPGVTAPSEPTAPFTGEARATLSSANLDATRLAYARQMHGAAAVRAPERGGFAGEADVLATGERGLPLAIFTADCLAIIVVDVEARALALAHVGWRGTVEHAQQAAVRALTMLGGRAPRAHVAIAPSIGPCCYEVDTPVIEAFTSAFGDRARGWMRPTRPGHVMLDLWAANEAVLVDAGIDPTRIENPRLCTACHPELLYSYRKGNRGRLVTVAALP